MRAAPLVWIANLRWVLLLAGILFLFGIGTGLHGYSISMWRELIDGSQAEEVLLGHPQPVRGDDWAAILPLVMAQLAHQPAFPVVNTNVGLGHNMLVPFPMPVAHVLTFFRPTTWGFFLGSDTGLAWMWWSRLLGLFLSMVLLAQILTRGRLGLALLAGAVLTASPFFLFWSLRPAPVASFGAIGFASALGLFLARRPVTIVLSGVLAGWSVAAFALVLYPPFQIPILYLLAPLLLAVAWEHRTQMNLREHGGWRVLASLLGGAIAIGAMALLLGSAGDALETMRNTAYPGRRLSTVGERSFWELLGSNLFLPLRTEKWGSLRNVCEAAGFWLLSLPLLAGMLWRRQRPEGSSGAVEVVLVVSVGVWLLHATVGAGDWIARNSGLGWVPARRSVIALGLADTLLVARLLSRTRPAGYGYRTPTVIALAWCALCAIAGHRLSSVVPDIRVWTSVLIAAANGGLVWFALTTRRRWIPLGVLATASIASSVWFNPVVRGGSSFLFENPLSQKILQIDRDNGGQTRWVAYGDLRVANLFRILGVNSLNGLHPVPQFEFWSKLDPEGRFHAAYDRYAHVAFQARLSPRLGIKTHGPDVVVVRMNPRPEFLRRLGVTHVLARANHPSALQPLDGLEPLASVGENHLYAVPQ